MTPVWLCVCSPRLAAQRRLPGLTTWPVLDSNLKPRARPESKSGTAKAARDNAVAADKIASAAAAAEQEAAAQAKAATTEPATATTEPATATTAAAVTVATGGAGAGAGAGAAAADSQQQQRSKFRKKRKRSPEADVCAPCATCTNSYELAVATELTGVLDACLPHSHYPAARLYVPTLG